MSKDEAYNDNNNVIRSMYQVLVLGDFGLEGECQKDYECC